MKSRPFVSMVSGYQSKACRERRSAMPVGPVPVAPLQGASKSHAIRGYRFAQPPATFWHPSGMLWTLTVAFTPVWCRLCQSRSTAGAGCQIPGNRTAESVSMRRRPHSIGLAMRMPYISFANSRIAQCIEPNIACIKAGIPEVLKGLP